MSVINVDFTGNAGVGVSDGNIVITGARDIQFPVNRNVIAVRRANGQFTYLDNDETTTVTVAVGSDKSLSYVITNT